MSLTEVFYRLIGKEYYKVHVVKQNKIIESIIYPFSEISVIEKDKKSYIIPDEKFIFVYKNAHIFYVDGKSCFSFKQYNLAEEMDKKEREGLLKSANVFNLTKYISSNLKEEPTDKLCEYKPIQLDTNPYALIDAASLYNILNAKFLKQIIEVPKSLMEALIENLPIIIFVGGIIIAVVIYTQSGR